MSSRNMQLNTTHCAKLGNNPSVPKAFGLRRFRSVPRFCNLNSNWLRPWPKNVTTFVATSTSKITRF
jgi:hypothetical protein